MDLPVSGNEPGFPALLADFFLPTEQSGKPQFLSYTHPTFLLSFAALIIEQQTICGPLTIALGFQKPHFVLFLAELLEHIPNADIKVRIPRLIN